VTEDEKEAGILAKALNEKNRERQKIESSFLKQAVAKVGEEVDLKEHKVIVLHNEDWHPGVMGIVASRIADRFFRPCILISMKDGIGRGSGRSVENFHLFDALTGCEDILEEYGGHKYACGLTILEGNIEQFKNRVNEKADSVVDVEKLSISLNVDMELGFSSLDHKVLEELYNLEPFGQGNPTPLLCSRNLRLIQPPRVIKGSHLKFWVTDGSKNIEAIGFGLAKDSEISKIVEGSPEIDLVYSASLNTWRGLNSIQLKIVDIKPSVSSQP
jgi:single-stranded-DNA-specific exonuclease